MQKIMQNMQKLIWWDVSFCEYAIYFVTLQTKTKVQSYLNRYLYIVVYSVLTQILESA